MGYETPYSFPVVPVIGGSGPNNHGKSRQSYHRHRYAQTGLTLVGRHSAGRVGPQRPGIRKKFQALIHQPTAEGFVIYIDGDHEHHSYWRLIDDKLYLDHTIRKSDYSEIDFSGIFVRDHTGYYPATFYSGTLPISGIFYQDGTKPIFVFEEGRLTYTNWTYPSFPCPSPMLGDPLFLHFDYMQFAQFTDGLWTCWMRILPDPSGNPITIQPLIVAHKSGIIDASDAAKKRLKTAIADSLKTVDFICDVNFSRGSIQAVLKTFEIPRPILYRKEIRKNGRRLVGYENATGRPIVPFGKYARCHTPIISENRIGIVETDEGKFIAIDHTGKKLFEIMFQSPVLSVEDLFRYGYFIYVTRNGRQGVATISGLRYTQPTHKPIDLSDVDRDVIKALIH